MNDGIWKAVTDNADRSKLLIIKACGRHTHAITIVFDSGRTGSLWTQVKWYIH